MASISIKGTKDGLLVTLGEGELTSLLAELQEWLGSTASFFKGGQVALEVGQRELSVREIEHIQALLAQHEVALGTVISQAPVTRAAASYLDLETKRSSRPERRPARRVEGEFSEGALVRCTLRSGQVIQHPGHVVVIGDVNAGAEVIAGGDVIIWGRLSGTVHAGAMGNDRAIVCALDLTPTQLRIGKYIARPPEVTSRQTTIPEVAFVQEGTIIVEAWKSDR